MKFVTFSRSSGAAPGVWLDNDRILDLQKGLGLPSLLAVIQSGETVLAEVRSLVSRSADLADAVVVARSTRLLAPIPRPSKNVFCVGRNYVDHVAEGARATGVDLKLPQVPQFFSKPPTAVTGPDMPVRLDPKVTRRFDYEVELAVIIGKTGRDIPRSAAFDHVFGYTILNDVTARDLQRRHDQWLKGKGLDTSCPMGPWIIDKDEIGDPASLELSITINGDLRQRATVSQMIFGIPEIIESLSSGLTLEAGDIIATGTPSGVGFAMDPPQYLKGGDIMECRIDRIGLLRNTIEEVGP